jgi:invasion protein IalB
MIYRNAWVPTQLANCTLGAVAKTAALTIAFAVASASLTLAQAPPPPKKPPAPAPAPAAPAKPAPQPQQAAPVQAAPQQGAPPELIFSPWTKFCLKGKDANPKEVCFTGKDARIESGMPVVAAVLIEPEGDPNQKKLLRVTLPLGVQLIHGTRVIIDNNQPMTAPYIICFTNGCMADYEFNADLVGKMKKGQQLAVQAINSTGQPISLGLPLADFAKAYDGPPTDPAVFEKQQQELQAQLQKRADDARKKLEQSQPGAATGQPGKTQ